jgi:hypothetical protein
MRPVLVTEGNHTKLRHTLIADDVLRIMVLGWGHPVIGSQQTRVKKGSGPITYPGPVIFLSPENL